VREERTGASTPNDRVEVSTNVVEVNALARIERGDRLLKPLFLFRRQRRHRVERLDHVASLGQLAQLVRDVLAVLLRGNALRRPTVRSRSSPRISFGFLLDVGLMPGNHCASVAALEGVSPRRSTR
jgi:hypothetical protein